ncbi:MAG: phage major capsid protein [Anaerolineae bacterium]|nr:phage major capsid protein [Anaerolineae bacterium]MCO5207639.1 phage major capsid protein [Anaerolineae bacterium]
MDTNQLVRTYGGAVTIKAETADHYVVAGYGVVFGGKDTYGDTFTADTDLHLDDMPHPPIYYEHGFNDTIKRSKLGRIVSTKMTDIGLWIEGELNKHSEYIDAVMDLVQRGVLGWSSGAVAHLVDPPHGGTFKNWPVYEFSLTPRPAEFRTLGVEKLKSELSAETDDTEATAEAEQDTAPDAVSHESAETKSAANAALDTATKAEDETMTDDILKAVKAVEDKVTASTKAIDSRFDEMDARIKALEETPAAKGAVPGAATPISHRGDNWQKAVRAYIFEGATTDLGRGSSTKDYTAGAGAPGGSYAVPTGHYQQIIDQRSEVALYGRLGVMPIPGGPATTVNVPIQAESSQEFTLTAEGDDHTQSETALGSAQNTLLRYTRKVRVGFEMMHDEDSRFFEWLTRDIVRGMALTHNGLLLAEVAANGTSFKTFAAGAIAAGDLEELEGNDTLGDYLEDPNVGWVMRNTTLAAIRSIVGETRMYGDQDGGGGTGIQAKRQVLEYPVLRSNKVAAIGTGNKSVYFGNWSFVGMREAPTFDFLRDPYSWDAGVIMRYQFRCAYSVLQAGAIGYGEHA